MAGVFFFFLGASIGSFLNVVIYRLPGDKSLIKPPSHCPECEKPIRWFDNIPILSYIILGGQCRDCGAEIPITYFLVETMTAFLYLSGYLRFGVSLELMTFLIFITLLIPISFIDFKEMLIPDSLSVSGIIIGLLLAVFRGGIFISLLGVAAGSVYILATIYIGKAIYKKDVMGFGDLKLAAMIGAFVGWANFLLTIPISAFIGSIYGLIQIRKGESSMQSLVPYGPFLSIGGVITFIFGEWIIIKFFLV